MSEMTQDTKTPEDLHGRGAWLNTRMDGLTVKSWIAVGLAIAVVVLGFGAWWTYGLNQTAGMDGQMGGKQAADVQRFPPVAGLYAGEEVFFIHTEASDAKVADMLTEMMDSPVLVVPELTQVPDEARGAVFVFTNGAEPEGPAGPFGFQPDVFDSAPGDRGYSPLREVHLVTWSDGAQPRILESADEVEEAHARGDVDIDPSGVIVNMPFVQWPAGHR
jgi:hypothetical protein